MSDFGAATPQELADFRSSVVAATASMQSLAAAMGDFLVPAVDDVVEYNDAHAATLTATVIGVYDDPAVVDLRAGQQTFYAVHYDPDGGSHSWRRQ